MDDRQRLAAMTKARRDLLGLSQAELATRAGISESTVRSIEAARRSGFRPGTLRPIAQALGWTPDSFQRILRGGEPIEAAAAAVRPPTHRLEETVAELQAQLADVLVRLRVVEERTEPDRPTAAELTAMAREHRAARVAAATDERSSEPDEGEANRSA